MRGIAVSDQSGITSEHVIEAMEPPKKTTWKKIDIAAFAVNGVLCLMLLVLLVLNVLFEMKALGDFRDAALDYTRLLLFVHPAGSVIALVVNLILLASQHPKPVPMETTSGNTVYVVWDKPKRRFWAGTLVAISVALVVIWSCVVLYIISMQMMYG